MGGIQVLVILLFFCNPTLSTLPPPKGHFVSIYNSQNSEMKFFCEKYEVDDVLKISS